FPVARNAFDADALRIYGGNRLEIIQTTSRAPCPRAQRTPVVRLASLALVHQSDNALGQTLAIIRLNAAGIDGCVSPTRGDQLQRRGKMAIASDRRWRVGRSWLRQAATAEHHQ